MRDFDEVLQSFYREPDVASALEAFDEVSREPESQLYTLYAFTLMAKVNTDFRAGLTSRHGQLVDAVLRGVPPLEDAPPGPEALDLLWTEFFVTGSLDPVRRIVAVLDEPDLVRERLTSWLQHIGIGPEGGTEFMKYLPLFQRLAFPIVFSESRVDGPVDLDLTVAITARNGQLQFTELPIELTKPELIRIAAKGAAVWSLRGIGARHEVIAKVCAEESKKPGGAARLLLSR
ncbi:MAG: hypothetical protein ACO1OB_28805 [Archangium sp.]